MNETDTLLARFQETNLLPQRNTFLGPRAFLEVLNQGPIRHSSLFVPRRIWEASLQDWKNTKNTEILKKSFDSFHERKFRQQIVKINNVEMSVTDWC